MMHPPPARRADLRLLADDKYSSALFLDYGGGFTVGPLGKKTDAFAAICELARRLAGLIAR